MNANFQRSTLVLKEPCLVIARTDGEVGIVLTVDALKEMEVVVMEVENYCV